MDMSCFLFVVKLTLKAPEKKIYVAGCANGVDSDEAAHNEPPHLDLHCLPSSRILPRPARGCLHFHHTFRFIRQQDLNSLHSLVCVARLSDGSPSNCHRIFTPRPGLDCCFLAVVRHCKQSTTMELCLDNTFSSSPEPKASGGVFSIGRLCCLSTISNDFSSKTTGLIATKISYSASRTFRNKS